MNLSLGLFAGACLAGAELGQMSVISVAGWAIPLFWPPIGLLVAALVLAPHRWWSVLLTALGAMATSMIALHGQPGIATISVCATYGLEACLAAWLLPRVTDVPFTLDRVAHVWRLAGVAVLAPMFGGLAFAGLVALATGVSSFDEAWLAWWLGDALGILLATPLMFVWMAEREDGGEAFRSSRPLELAAVIAGTLTAMQIVFGNVLPAQFRVPTFVLPWLLWAVLRLGPGGVAVTMSIVSLLAFWHTIHGRGPFALPEASNALWALRLPATAAVTSLSFLLLASILAERKRALQEREVLVTELQRALSEVRVLQGLIPICAWCHKIRDDAGFWERIETYLQARTDATFSHSICPACTSRVHEKAESEEPVGQ